MLRATKPFKDQVNNYINPNEPSLRIGRMVPKNAVNLAYYYNPTATDAEKIMSAEAPRQTIDHRVETAYRYLFDVAGNSDGTPPPDDMFPSYVMWSDEENYSGKLNRKSVEWYPENHVNTKNITFKKDEIVDAKGRETKSIEYVDDDGYNGMLYLDTVEYDVHAREEKEDVLELEYKVNDFELNKKIITGYYTIPTDLDKWTGEPPASKTWPAALLVTPTGIVPCDASGNEMVPLGPGISTYLNTLDNPFEGVNETFTGDDYEILNSTKPVGLLHFSSLEYSPVGYYVETEDGKEVLTDSSGKMDGLIDANAFYKGDSWSWGPGVAATELEKLYCKIPASLGGGSKPCWEAHYSHDDDYYGSGGGADYSKDDYDSAATDAWMSEIQQWLAMTCNTSAGGTYSPSGNFMGSSSYMVKVIEDAVKNEYDIVISVKNPRIVIESNPELTSALPEDADMSDPSTYEGYIVPGTGLMHWELDFQYEITDRGKEGILKYDVFVNYSGVLKRTIKTRKTIPTQYLARCSYVGLARKSWITWDGKAFYMGSVTKGNSVGNMNPEDDNELLMFPDDNGFLRQVVYGFNEEDQKPEVRYYYRVEADYVWLTDVFKNGIACFYKYRLKKPIYDYRGPDSRGFYHGDAVATYTAAMKETPNDYVHNIKLTPAEYETVEEFLPDGTKVEKNVPKRYYADLYCSYISSSTDTFSAVYNAFNDIADSNIDIENGVTEKIYNYPWSRQDVDYEMVSVIPRARVNKIRLKNYTPIEDTRRYVNVKYEIIVERKKDGKTFTSEPREARILNKEYSFASEEYLFEDRAYIISPELDGDGIKASPRDIIFRDQAAKAALYDSFETVIYNSDTDFIYKCNLISISGDGSDIKTVKDGSVNVKCNPDGSGLITAETTIDTGFYDEEKGTYTGMLNMDSPYWVEGNHIHPGWKVKCIDSRYIKVKAPREDALLDSWYPLIQFGHYTRILDQYGTHLKVCYAMPEYDTQRFSNVYGKPIVDIENEKVEIINPHMVKTLCYPIYIHEPVPDKDTYYFKNKTYKVIKTSCTWRAANAACKSMGGNLAMPRTREEVEFIRNVAIKYNVEGMWLGATDEEQEGVWRWTDGTLMQFDNWNTGEPNNLNGTEHYLETYTNNIGGKWNDLGATDTVDGYICEFDNFGIMLYKKVGNELYRIEVENVSFSDGIIITKDTISENDDIYCSYHYLEENYVYRGYWRDAADFARLDLNPNIYHTYNDLKYTPSEVKPSKNLFNKVIYFFMRPSVMYEMNSDYDDLYYNVNKQKKVPVTKKRMTVKTRWVEKEGVPVYEDRYISDVEIVNDEPYQPLKIIAEFIGNDYIGPFSVRMENGHFYGFNILESSDGVSFYQTATSGMDHATHTTNPLEVKINSVMLKGGYTYRIQTKECPVGTTAGGFHYTLTAPGGTAKFLTKTTKMVEEQYEEEEEYIEYKYVDVGEEGKVLKEYDECLYHKIDDDKPDNDEDMLIGSVYIRQNTSLHSTVVVDARTRGGGVLEEIEDKIRHALEPESDFYLDIGFYDGEPYQENGVLIIRLDNKLLQEFGGRFTRGDIEQRVKRWMAFGVYPIIEFVDAYTKYELPQYTLEVEEEYKNVSVLNDDFEFIVEPKEVH